MIRNFTIVIIFPHYGEDSNVVRRKLDNVEMHYLYFSLSTLK
jgi:hypothetical protein